MLFIVGDLIYCYNSISGSLTKLTDGKSYLIAGSGMEITSASNGQVTISTTGGAARVMSWLEEFLQTEWLDMQVFCTSVTEQWSVLSISGPNARNFLSELTDIDLSKESFPFMRFREWKVCGIDAIVFRISFTG